MQRSLRSHAPSRPGDRLALTLKFDCADALTSNTAYANVHMTSGTTPENAFPGGEIRGQVHSAEEEHEHDHGQGH